MKFKIGDKVIIKDENEKFDGKQGTVVNFDISDEISHLLGNYLVFLDEPVTLNCGGICQYSHKNEEDLREIHDKDYSMFYEIRE